MKPELQNKIILGKLLGEYYKSQQKAGCLDLKSEHYNMDESEYSDYVNALCAGFEHVIDLEMQRICPITTEEYNNIFTVLYDYNSGERVSALTDYYEQIQPQLLSSINRPKFMKTVKQLYVEGHCSLAIERLVSADIKAPIEFRRILENQ